MKLKSWDFDQQNFVETEYPDAPIAEFINWLRTTKRWLGDPEHMNRRVLQLERALTEHRQATQEAGRLSAAAVTGGPHVQGP